MPKISNRKIPEFYEESLKDFGRSPFYSELETSQNERRSESSGCFQLCAYIRKLSRCFWDVVEFHTIGIKNVQSRHVIYTCKEKLFLRCSTKNIRKHDLRVVQSSSTPIFRQSKNHFLRLVFSFSFFFFLQYFRFDYMQYCETIAISRESIIFPTNICFIQE